MRTPAVVMIALLLASGIPFISGTGSAEARPISNEAAASDRIPAVTGSVYVLPAYAHPDSGGNPTWIGACNFPTEGDAACANAPPTVNLARATFDNATGDRYVIVEGGKGSTGAAMNETWKWIDGNWSKVLANAQTAVPAPVQASNVSMTYDGTDGYVLLVGGWLTSAASNQSWSFHAGTWTKRPEAAGVKVGGGSCLVWVPPTSGKGDYVLLFGGGQTSGPKAATTWTYKAGTWTNATASIGTQPTPRENMACAWDPQTHTVDMFGGWTGAHTVSNALYRFDPTGGTAGTWTATIANNTAGSPPARQQANLWYDSTTGKMVLSGGAQGNQLKTPTALPGGFDTWSLSGTTWTNITSLVHIPTAYAAGSWGAAGTYSAPYAYGFRFGGAVAAAPTTALVAEWGVRVTATLSLAPALPQLNQPLWFNVSSSGGTGIYHYNWTGLPAGCTPSNISSITCSTSIGGVYNISVNVTDSAGSPWPASVALLNGTLTLPTPPITTAVNGTLVGGGIVGVHYSNPFFGFVQAPVPTWASGNYSGGVYVNSTPFRYLRAQSSCPSLNPTTACWVAPNGGGAYTMTGSPTWNSTAFKAWFSSLPAGRVSWLGYLPAQVNSSSFAQYTAQWFHGTYGIAPTVWQFGNEPIAWTHYGENYSAWNTADASQPTAVAYASMVGSYAAAVRSLYPNDQFVGVESSSGFNVPLTYISDTVAADYAVLRSVSFHEYPSPNQTNPYGAIGAYYSSLTSRTGIANAMTNVKSAITTACAGNATCLNLGVEIGEYQGGPAGNLSVYDGLFQGAVYMAVSVVLALSHNATSLQVFPIADLVRSSVVSPEGLFFQRMAANLTMGTVRSENVTGAGAQLFAVRTANGTHTSLLFVNANLTHAVNLSVGSAFPEGVSGSTYLWDPSTSVPRFTALASLPSNYTIPSQGILLVENFNGIANGSLTGGGALASEPTLFLEVGAGGLMVFFLVIALVFVMRDN